MSQGKAKYEFRFGGIGRLYGPDSLNRIRSAHVCVVGIGGVGSWIAEALARSGIGNLTMVDLDDICESNINRQVHALDGVIGSPKIEVMAERCRHINPDCTVRTIHAFYTEKAADQILNTPYDYLADAIDSVKHKCSLIAKCRELNTPVITSGGAGGRIDPTQIQIADLSRSYNDRLLQRVRKILRNEYRFPRQEKRKFKVDCVFSPETAVYPQTCDTDPGKTSHRLDCSSGYGAASYVTGAFGLVAAGHIVKAIAGT